MYHYSLLFPWQVEQKVKVYKDEKPDECAGIIQWAENNYFKLGDRFRVHNIYSKPSWLVRFHGNHPEQIDRMMKDIKDGRVKARLRRNNDIEAFIDSYDYKVRIFLVKFRDYLERITFQLSRIKNIPNRVKKVLTK